MSSCANRTKIRAGMYAFDDYAYISDCISGMHLVAYERMCASRARLRIEAVAVAILQVRQTLHE
jgi:hypothetical protein